MGSLKKQKLDPFNFKNILFSTLLHSLALLKEMPLLIYAFFLCLYMVKLWIQGCITFFKNYSTPPLLNLFPPWKFFWERQNSSMGFIVFKMGVILKNIHPCNWINKMLQILNCSSIRPYILVRNISLPRALRNLLGVSNKFWYLKFSVRNF